MCRFKIGLAAAALLIAAVGCRAPARRGPALPSGPAPPGSVSLALAEWEVRTKGSATVEALGAPPAAWALAAGDAYGVATVQRSFPIRGGLRAVEIAVAGFEFQRHGHAEIRLTLWQGTTEIAQYYHHLGTDSGPYHLEEQRPQDHYRLHDQPAGDRTVTIDLAADKGAAVTEADLAAADRAVLSIQADTWRGGSRVAFQVHGIRLLTP